MSTSGHLDPPLMAMRFSNLWRGMRQREASRTACSLVWSCITGCFTMVAASTFKWSYVIYRCIAEVIEENPFWGGMKHYRFEGFPLKHSAWSLGWCQKMTPVATMVFSAPNWQPTNHCALNRRPSPWWYFSNILAGAAANQVAWNIGVLANEVTGPWRFKERSFDRKGKFLGVIFAPKIREDEPILT